MDDITIREYLAQIGPDFQCYADYFLKHRFTNVASLRCIQIPEDIDYIFGTDLSLGERRQLECALKELKNIAKNDTSDTVNPEPSKVKSEPKTSAFQKIAKNVDDRIIVKKEELRDEERRLQEMDKPLHEPLPQGSYLHSRCTNCHIRGHKADNNKGNNVCPNEKCTDYLLCGQRDRHKEYKEEKKRVQSNIRKLRVEIEQLTQEKNSAVQFDERNTNSFVKLMKERLRKSNPYKYKSCSTLMHDLMALKSAYDNKLPPVTQNDREIFPKMIDRVTQSKACSRDDFSDSFDNHDSDESFDSGCPPMKKMCTVSPQSTKTSSTPNFQMPFISSPMYSNPYGMPFIMPFQNFLQQPQYPIFMDPRGPQQHQPTVQNPFFVDPRGYQQPTVQNPVVKQQDENGDSKPKLWSPYNL